MTTFIQINNENPITIMNIDSIECVQVRTESDGSVYYSVVTNCGRYPMDEAGYTRLFNNPFVAAIVDKWSDEE